MDDDWAPETTGHAASLQGTAFARRPLSVHRAILYTLCGAAEVGIVSSSSTDAQLAQAEALRAKAVDFIDSLYPGVTAIVRGLDDEREWVEIADRDLSAEAFAAPLVKRALGAVWGGRPEPAVYALGYLLDQVAKDPATVDEGLRRAGFMDLKTVEDFTGDLKDLKMTMALSALLSGTPANSMAAAVIEAAEALLYAERLDDARTLVLDYCRSFSQPVSITQLADVLSGAHQRERLSDLAERAL